MYKSIIWGFITLCACQMANGADITRDVRETNSSPLLENGGYFAIGLGVEAVHGTWQKKDENDTDYVHTDNTVLLSGAYRRNRFFFEAERGTLDGLNMGLTAWSNHQWAVDALLSVPGGSLSTKDYVVADQRYSEAYRNNHLLDRLTLDNWITGVGVRATQYYDDYVIQYRLLTDIHKGNGLFGSVRLGRSWQKKNWNLYSLISAEFYSKDISNYRWGVSEEEATTRFEAFEADAGALASIKLGATYPLSEHWVFDSSLLVKSLTGAERDSPLLNNKDYFIHSQASISYVF